MKYKKEINNIHKSISALAIKNDINEMVDLPSFTTENYIKRNYNTVKITDDEEYVEVIYDITQDNNLKLFYLCKLVKIHDVVTNKKFYKHFDEKYLFQTVIDETLYHVNDQKNWIHDPSELIVEHRNPNYNPRHIERKLPIATTRLYCKILNELIDNVGETLMEVTIGHMHQIIKNSTLRIDCTYLEDDGRWYYNHEIRTIGDTKYWVYSQAYRDAESERYGMEARERLNDYHCGITPITYIKTRDKNDRKGLDKFTIGFEVEKSYIPESEWDEDTDENYVYLGKTPLYSHWERDSSCGMEGVTNVYSLNNLEQFKKHAHLSSELTDDFETNGYCGGHTNIGYNPENITDFELSLYTIMPSVGVLYAMYKRRLNNQYSCNNKKLNYDDRERSYSVIRLKTNPQRLEFRLASAIKNTDQLIRRFITFSKIMSHIYSRCMEPEKYTMDCESVNAFLDIKYSKRSLYKNFRQDKLFTQSFFNTPTYKRTRWLLHDLEPELDNAYVGYSRANRLAEVISDTYAFQSWLDEINLANTENIRDYVTNYSYSRCDIPEDDQVNNLVIPNPDRDDTSTL